MTTIKISSLVRNLVGNLATVRAEIMEDAGSYLRVKETIEVEIEGGARMTDDELRAAVLEKYNA